MGALASSPQERRSSPDRLSGLVLLARSRGASHPAPLGAAGVTSDRHGRVRDARRIRMDRSGVWVGLRNVLAVLPRSGEDQRSLSLPSTGRAEAAELACFDCDPHRIPGETCSCGFYAMKSLDMLREPTEVNIIFGKIAMAGKVIDHEFGYRAELARILALIPLEGRDRREGVGLAPVPPPNEVCATLAASGSNRLNARAEVRARAGRRGSTSRCRRVRRPARP
jgi:hypothetical protein